MRTNGLQIRSEFHMSGGRETSVCASYPYHVRSWGSAGDGLQFRVGNFVTLTALYLERRDRTGGRSIAGILLSSYAAETITSGGGISRCHRMLRRHTPAPNEPHHDWQIPDSETGGRATVSATARDSGLVHFLCRTVPV
jgi:hypothetical protein